MNPWKVLGVHRKSTQEEIHHAYINLAKKHHPDLGGDAEIFKSVNDAHKMLATKKDIQYTLNVVFAGCRDCGVCKGTGVKSKSKGITEKIYVACKACDGSGLNIKEEEINNVIEL